MKYNVNVNVQADISNSELTRMVRNNFRKDRDYKVENGKLYVYDRVNWNDYDYVEETLPNREIHESVVRKVKLEQKIMKQLHKIFNLDIQGNEL